MRTHWTSTTPGNAQKAMEAVHTLAELDDPPQHFPLGKDALEVVKKAATGRLADLEKYSSWSDDL